MVQDEVRVGLLQRPHLGEEHLLVRDVDLGQIREVRERWQFFRDRRPDAYGPIVAP